MNIHVLINPNANSDTDSTPPLIGQQRHRQSTYLAVRDLLVAMRVFCDGTVSSFTRGVPSRGVAAWCRPAVNQILLTRSAARRYIDALHARKPIISLRQRQFKFLPSGVLCVTALCAAKSIILLRSGRCPVVNQKKKFVQNCCVNKMYMCTCLVFVRICIQNYEFALATRSAPDTQSRSAEANIVVFGMG